MIFNLRILKYISFLSALPALSAFRNLLVLTVSTIITLFSVSIFSTVFIFFTGCANPLASVKKDVASFKEKFPTHFEQISLNNRQLNYAWSGDVKKRPLIFVHGSPGSWEGWAHFLLDSDLQKKFHVIAVDRTGYGGSNIGLSEKSLQKQAELIIEVLKNNKSNLPAILVGHSYGGPVVAKMAVDYSSKVAGVIFVASSVDPDLEKTKWYQYPANWWLMKSLIPKALRVCNEEILGLKDELTQMLPEWKQFSAKVILIHGETDDLVPVANQDFLLKVLDPKIIIEVERVKGLNHFIPWKRPDLIFNGIANMDKVIENESKSIQEFKPK